MKNADHKPASLEWIIRAKEYVEKTRNPLNTQLDNIADLKLDPKNKNIGVDIKYVNGPL